jgi:hypothetical protein
MTLLGGTTRASDGGQPFVVGLQNHVENMSLILGLTPVQPKSNGIPHRLDAIIFDIQAVQAALNAAIQQVNGSLTACQSATLTDLIAVQILRAQLDALRLELDATIQYIIYPTGAKEGIVINDLFDAQAFMNTLGQASEMSVAVTSAANQAITCMAHQLNR